MKSDRKTKSELIAELKSVRRKLKKLETLQKKDKLSELYTTERKQTEDALRKSEERFRSLFENSLMGISQASPDGRLICANTPYAQMYGYINPEEMMTHIPDVGQLYSNPEDRKNVISILKEKGIMEPREMAVKHRDGTRFFVLVGAREIKDSKGNLLYYQAEHVDITERKRAEDALRESEERYRTLFEKMDEGFCVVEMLYDPNGKAVDYRFVEINPAFEKHTGLQQAVGKTIREMVPNHEAHWFEIYGKVARTGEAIRFQNSADAMKRCYDVFAFRIDGDASQRVAILFNDITKSKLSEVALRESEVRFRELFNRMSSGVAVYEAIDNGGDFMLRDFNPAAEKIEKVSREDILGRRVTEVFPGVKTFGVFEVFQRVWQTGKPEYFPQNIYKKDEEDPGSWRESWVFKLPTDEIVAIYNDITERKRMEVELQSEQKMLTRTESIAHVGSWEWDIATDTVIWSDELFRIFQRDPREGAPSFAEHPAFYHPDDMARLQKVVEAAAADGTPYALELRAIRKDGETRMCVARGVAEMPPGGRAVRLFGSLQDITDHKRAEEALRESESKYRDLIDQAWDAIFVVDSTGKMLLVNEQACRILGYTQEELLQLNVADTYLVKERAIAAQRMATLQQGDHLRYERSMVRKDGTTFPVDVTIGMLPNGLIQGIVRDITERKREEEEISKSRKELRMLADHLQNIREEERNHLAREFHDQLGQSMTALKMDLSLLLRTISDEKQNISRTYIAEELKSAKKLIDEMSRLVWEIIADLRPQMLDDLGLLTALEWETEGFESRTGISCEFQSSAGDIQMDSKKSIALFRIYQEVLTNIIRHANATVVKSVLRRDDEMLVFEIKDNGRGITLNEQLKSNSFGLIGMRERAMALGGQFKISGNAGEGTTIIVRLPL